MNTTKTEVNVEITEIGSPEETGEMCLADYSLSLTVGDDEYELSGWKLCGWLPPGSHADLDGSGLAVWGSGQHGGWRSIDGGGGVPCRPHVCVVGDEIEINNGEGGGRSHTIAGDESLAERIQDAIDNVVDDIEISEPDSETIYGDLDDIDGVSGVRVGDWQSAGIVLAWEDGDGYDHRCWPDDNDVDAAMAAVNGLIAGLVRDAIEYATPDA